MTERNIRLTLSYDGTDFCGWQRQKGERSAQEELEKALSKMHGHPILTVAAGRTDTGVHARGQVANFYTDIASIPAERFLPALNKLLPRDIRILAASDADHDFHSRYDARLRRYRYFTLCGSQADPVRLRYAHFIHRRPDIQVLNAMASRMLGETDFTALSSARDESLSRFRFVEEASFRWEGEHLVFEIAANAFLLRMVRSIMGSLLWFEAEGRSPGDFAALLASRDRKAAGPTAPARGLFLWNVEYYPEPTRKGRGAYWTAGPGRIDDQDTTTTEGGGATKAEGLGAVPRLVPGLGYLED